MEISEESRSLAELNAIALRRASLDRVEVNLIGSARAAGASWARIAEALDLGSRQAAEQRFHRISRRMSQDVTDTGGPKHHRRSTLLAIDVPRGIHPTRRRLINAAAAVLSERGYASTRLSDIADLAGMQPGSIYYHYKSKDELIVEVLRMGVGLANRAVISAVAQLPVGVAAIDRLKTAIRAHLQVMLRLDSIARAHVNVYRQLPGTIKERVRPLRRANAQLWTALIQDALDEGALRPDVDPFLMQIFLVNTIDAALNWSSRATSTNTLAGQLGRLILEGVGI